MAIPYVVSQEVWKTQAVSDTQALNDQFSKCANIVIEVITVGFSGTLDIQGRKSETADFANVLYYQTGQATPQSPTIAQLTFTTSTATVSYCVPEYQYRHQLVMTRSAGTITVNVVGISETLWHNASFFRSLIHGSDGAGAYPASVVDQSIIAKMLSKVAGGDTSSYNNTTDSLEALADAIAAIEAALPSDPADESLLEAAIAAGFAALPVLTETGGTLTTDGNVQNLYINNAPSGVYRPICLKIDFTAHTATETVVITLYYRIKVGGNWIPQDVRTFAGVQTSNLINIDLEPNRYGVNIQIQKTAGTNRAYDWEIFYEA